MVCGIIGITLSEDALDKPLGSSIKEALKRLEYRGYDSVGFALIDKSGRLIVRKSKGMIDAVAAKVGFDLFDGYTGIGHTRWATHGPPSDVNSHPHTDCSGRIAVAHNGIIENYRELKEMLVDEGHVFVSETDTEVIPHLIEEFEKKGFKPYEAFKKAVELLKGAYAIVAINVNDPRKIFFARNTSPLVLGFGVKANFVASDAVAFLNFTRKVLALRDGEVGYITPEEVVIEKLEFKEGKPTWVAVDFSDRVKTIDWTVEMASKGGFKHFMLKEIHEQPYALASTIASAAESVDRLAKILTRVNKVLLTGAGTSYHAAYVAALLLRKYAGLWALPVVSSEAQWWLNTVREGDVVLGISQSGETIDTLKAIREAKKRGALTVAVSNVIDSAIPRESDIAVYTRAGPEIGVAATKTFTTQVALLGYLSLKTGLLNGILNESEFSEVLKSLRELPNLVKQVINTYEARMSSLAEELKSKPSAYFLGRGLGFPLSMEGALKLKEVAYIHAEAYPAGESKHGPIALVEEGFPTIFTVVTPEEGELIKSNIEEMKARGSLTIAVVPKNLEDLIKLVRTPIKMPVVKDVAASALYVVPHQLLAYYTSVKKGLDPDKPRNLAKTVTVF